MTGAHRVAWMLENGEIPKGLDVAHKCSRRICVRESHLDVVTRKRNMEHRTGPNKRRAERSSKYNGVAWDKERQKWIVNITHNSRTHFGGRFPLDQEEAAAEAARNLRNKLFTYNHADRKQEP